MILEILMLSLLNYAVPSIQPQSYTMNENMAYGMNITPSSNTFKWNDRHTGQRTIDDGIDRKKGNYFIVDDSVYEVPSVN